MLEPCTGRGRAARAPPLGTGVCSPARGEGLSPRARGQVCVHLCGAPQATLNQSWETWPALPSVTATAGSVSSRKGLSGSQRPSIRGLRESRRGGAWAALCSAWVDVCSFGSGVLFMGTKSSLVFMLVVFFRHSLIHSNVYSESTMYAALC